MIGTTKATGSAALSLEVAPGRPWQLEEIRIHLNAAGGSGNLTVTLDSVSGAAYNAVLLKQDMAQITDFVFAPERPMTFNAGDKIVIAWANSGGKTYGVEVKHKVVGV